MCDAAFRGVKCTNETHEIVCIFVLTLAVINGYMQIYPGRDQNRHKHESGLGLVMSNFLELPDSHSITFTQCYHIHTRVGQFQSVT